MAKYAVHTKWSWPNGVPSAETMQEWHREHRSNTKAEDIIWFKIDENTHQSVIIYSSEADAKEENARRHEMRKQTIEETGHSMVEETMGPILSIMSKPNPPFLTLGHPIGSLAWSYLLRSLPKSHGQRHRTINLCVAF